MTPRTYASQPSTSAVMAPWSFPFHDPDQWRGVSWRQVRPGPSSGSGSGACQAYLTSSRQLLPNNQQVEVLLVGALAVRPL